MFLHLWPPIKGAQIREAVSKLLLMAALATTALLGKPAVAPGGGDNSGGHPLRIGISKDIDTC